VGATYVRQGDHHVGHWHTCILVFTDEKFFTAPYKSSRSDLVCTTMATKKRNISVCRLLRMRSTFNKSVRSVLRYWSSCIPSSYAWIWGENQQSVDLKPRRVSGAAAFASDLRHCWRRVLLPPRQRIIVSADQFLPRDAMLARYMLWCCVRLSIRLSVCRFWLPSFLVYPLNQNSWLYFVTNNHGWNTSDPSWHEFVLMSNMSSAAKVDGSIDKRLKRLRRRRESVRYSTDTAEPGFRQHQIRPASPYCARPYLYPSPHFC